MKSQRTKAQQSPVKTEFYDLYLIYTSYAAPNVFVSLYKISVTVILNMLNLTVCTNSGSNL